MGTNVLTVASGVIDHEEVVVGVDQFKNRIGVQVDNTVGSDFNNTTNPLTVIGLAQEEGNYLSWVSLAPPFVGQKALIGTERLQITGIAGTDVTFARGVDGTTNSIHAGGVRIDAAKADLSGKIIVQTFPADGATTTAAEFTTWLAYVMNADATENISAVRDSATQVTVTNSGASNLACSETLAGTGNQWAAATIVAASPTPGHRTWLASSPRRSYTSQPKRAWVMSAPLRSYHGP